MVKYGMTHNWRRIIRSKKWYQLTKAPQLASTEDAGLTWLIPVGRPITLKFTRIDLSQNKTTPVKQPFNWKLTETEKWAFQSIISLFNFRLPSVQNCTETAWVKRRAIVWMGCIYIVLIYSSWPLKALLQCVFCHSPIHTQNLTAAIYLSQIIIWGWVCCPGTLRHVEWGSMGWNQWPSG